MFANLEQGFVPYIPNNCGFTVIVVIVWKLMSYPVISQTWSYKRRLKFAPRATTGWRNASSLTVYSNAIRRYQGIIHVAPMLLALPIPCPTAFHMRQFDFHLRPFDVSLPPNTTCFLRFTSSVLSYFTTIFTVTFSNYASLHFILLTDTLRLCFITGGFT